MSAELERLFPGSGPVLLDGAMGTALRALGWPVSEPTVLANLDARESLALQAAGLGAGRRLGFGVFVGHK